MSIIIPTVIEKNPKGDKYHDIYSRLLIDRVVFLLGQVEDNMANSIVAQLLYLEAADPGKDIHLYINSPGGSVTAGLSILDTMNFISSDVRTYCLGQACSMGALLLTAGAPGKRYCLPNGEVMIHQPLGGFQGQASDIHIRATQILKCKDRLNKIIADTTGQPIEKVAKDTDRDNFMFAEEAKAYGLVDHVISKLDKNS